MSLEAFGVKNLRCLGDTGLVPIRPITVLVGRNSSGKSTFLRAFPLLRQSVEKARNSPILWYDRRFVDFGSLADAANNRLAEPTVTFRFVLRLPYTGGYLRSDSAYDIAMTLAGGEVPYVSDYEIRVEGHVVRWELDAQGRLLRFTADDRVIGPTSQFGLGGDANLMPTLQVDGYGSSELTFHPPDESQFYESIETNAAMALLGKLVAPKENRAPEENRAAGSPRRSGRVQFFPSSGTRIDETTDFATIASLSPVIIGIADLVLSDMMSRVAYLKPLRVSPERAYRIQNLAVNEVEPDGENLPMFIRSLTPDEAKGFAAFTQTTLGFETTVKTIGHHAEILIREGQSQRFVNLVDVGFGYSEVLPLAAVLWATCIRPKMHGEEPAPIIAIEQPELHLHPAAQSKLARMFAEAALQSGGSKIIIETHSESLINGFGKLINEGLLKASDVQIALFDKDDETGEATVSLAGYRDNGALHDWPYGFLSPVGERRVPSTRE